MYADEYCLLTSVHVYKGNITCQQEFIGHLYHNINYNKIDV